MLAQIMATILLLPAAVPLKHWGARGAWLLRSAIVRLVLVGGLLTAVIAGVFWVGGDRLAASFEAARGEIVASDQPDQGLTRMKIWQATLQMIKDHPIAGVGMGGYWMAITAYHKGPGALQPQQ